MVIVADGTREADVRLSASSRAIPASAWHATPTPAIPRLSERPRSITSSCPWGRHESRSNHADPTAGTRAPAHRTHRGVALPCSRRDGIVRQRPYHRAQRHPQSLGPRTLPVRGPRTGGDDAGALPPCALPRFSVRRPRRAADGDVSARGLRRNACLLYWGPYPGGRAGHVPARRSARVPDIRELPGTAAPDARAPRRTGREPQSLRSHDPVHDARAAPLPRRRCPLRSRADSDTRCRRDPRRGRQRSRTCRRTWSTRRERFMG